MTISMNSLSSRLFVSILFSSLLSFLCVCSLICSIFLCSFCLTFFVSVNYLEQLLLNLKEWTFVCLIPCVLLCLVSLAGLLVLWLVWHGVHGTLHPVRRIGAEVGMG